MQDEELTDEDWGALEALATSTMREQSQVRELLPRGPDAHGAYMVELPQLKKSDGRLELDVSRSEKPTLAYCEFKVQSEQLADRRVYERLVREAARRVGRAEDTILAKGGKLELGGGVVLKPANVGDGIVTNAKEIRPEDGLPNRLVPLFGAAVAALEAAGWPPPYAAILGPRMWARVAAETPSGRRTTGLDVVRSLLGEESKLVPIAHELSDEANTQSAVVVSRASGGFEVVEVAAATIADVDMERGDRILRVEERFKLRVLDSKAAVLIVTPPPPHREATDHLVEAARPRGRKKQTSKKKTSKAS